MKLALVLLLATSIAHAEDKPPPQAAPAKAWLATLLDGTAAAPPGPIAFVVQSQTKSCKKLAAGKAANAKALKSVGTCLSDDLKKLVTLDEPVKPGEWRLTDAEDAANDFFSKKHKKAITEAIKDTTLVTVHYTGEMVEVVVTVAVRADNGIAAVIIQDWSID